MISRPLTLWAALAFARFAPAVDFPTPHNSETTPGTPMPAEEAAAKWKLPPGFKAQVFAAEPDVQNPIACAWDSRGRLWVAENFTYAERTVKWEAKLRDRVLIFEDADGDGRHDKRTVFADDLQHLTGLEVGRGGVWLICPSQLLFIPDRDRNDQPDGPAEVVLDGFTVPPENHHNFANGLRWGPDGWLYGRCGASAPGLVGKPGEAAETRVPLTGGIWRYHPAQKRFEVLCHGTTNPWGSDWNADGEMFFTNTVNGHLWHMIPGAHLTRPHTIDPNPYVYQLLDQHADHYHFDTGKGWMSSRDADGGSDALGGGHAHCGAMIYLGDNWPAEYRGKLMTLNFHGRRINVDRLERHGSGYVGKHEPDICFSADPFFRGIDLTYGPDGGVYILDWSDTGECHENTGVHRESGRIYKITYGEAKSPVLLNPVWQSNDELIERIGHSNEWVVRMARNELIDRLGGVESYNPKPLLEMMERGPNSAAKIRALQTLHAIGQLEPATEIKNLDDAAQPVAIRLLGDFFPIQTVSGASPTQESSASGGSGDSDLIRSNFLTGTKRNSERDERLWAEALEAASYSVSPAVRLAVASSLQRLPAARRGAIARNLAAHADDAEDHNIPLLIWYGIAPLGDSRPQDLVEIAKTCEIPLVLRFIARRLSTHQPAHLAALAEVLKPTPQGKPWRWASIATGMHEGFTGWRKAPKPAGWDEFASKFGETGDAQLFAKIRDLSVLFGDGRALDDVRKLALDDKAELESRKAALRSLIDARPDDLRVVCEKLLGVRFLNTVAARGLALSDDPAIGLKLAKNYKTFHPSERGAVIDTLVSRPTFAKALLEEMASGRIAREDLTAYHARQIRNFNDEPLTRLLGQAWGEVRESAADKRALIARLKEALTPAVLTKADKSAGRALFGQLCASCHTLYGQGGQIGPDLTGSGRANLDYLLENIVDPGAVVTADFRLNIITMKDGRVLNGMVAAKTDRTLTLKTMTEPITVERAEIAKQEELPQSLMPESLLAALSEEQIRDLIAYLAHPAQVPLPGAQ